MPARIVDFLRDPALQRPGEVEFPVVAAAVEGRVEEAVDEVPVHRPG
jgi:hypothetical protein